MWSKWPMYFPVSCYRAIQTILLYLTFKFTLRKNWPWFSKRELGCRLTGRLCAWLMNYKTANYRLNLKICHFSFFRHCFARWCVNYCRCEGSNLGKWMSKRDLYKLLSRDDWGVINLGFFKKIKILYIYFLLPWLFSTWIRRTCTILLIIHCL